MMKISPLILMFTIFASSMSSYAGFADSLRDLRGTLSQINETRTYALLFIDSLW